MENVQKNETLEDIYRSIITKVYSEVFIDK